MGNDLFQFFTDIQILFLNLLIFLSLHWYYFSDKYRKSHQDLYHIYITKPYNFFFQESNRETEETASNSGKESTYSQAQSTLSAVINTHSSFKKLFLSEANFPHNVKSHLSRPQVLKSQFRWSRKKSSRYINQMPTLVQINAGKRVIQKYRKFARNLEYKRLHSIIPSLSKRKYASKVINFALYDYSIGLVLFDIVYQIYIITVSSSLHIIQARILHEAIQYIDKLHNQLVDSIRTKGLPPILQNMKSNLIPNALSNENSQGQYAKR